MGFLECFTQPCGNTGGAAQGEGAALGGIKRHTQRDIPGLSWEKGQDGASSPPGPWGVFKGYREGFCKGGMLQGKLNWGVTSLPGGPDCDPSFGEL